MYNYDITYACCYPLQIPFRCSHSRRLVSFRWAPATIWPVVCAGAAATRARACRKLCTKSPPPPRSVWIDGALRLPIMDQSSKGHRSSVLQRLRLVWSPLCMQPLSNWHRRTLSIWNVGNDTGERAPGTTLDRAAGGEPNSEQFSRSRLFKHQPCSVHDGSFGAGRPIDLDNSYAAAG